MQTIKVATIFDKGKIKPVWFINDGRKYLVREINYEWVKKNGASKVHHFAVSDGTNTFELSFDDIELIWKIED
ncbi:MAG: hypothetical protein WC490_06025 [Candidatus Margulisiibacteriota bacterium]